MTTFIPKSITAVASKSGKTYWKIDTDQGEASCFDYPIVQEIEKSLNRQISLYDLETNERGFLNIRKAKMQAQMVKPTQAFQPAPVMQMQSQSQPEIKTNFEDARKEKNISVYTSYAKDLFIEMRKNQPKTDEAVMFECVKLIQQARKSFEDWENLPDY